MSAPASAGTPYPAYPAVMTQDCPIATSLKVLGRKWTLTILRDVAFFPKAGFGLIRRRNPGIRPRVLSTRLQELGREDLVRRVVPPEDLRHPYYELTAKGLEIWPILSSLYSFGIQHHADRVFEDGRPRTLSDIYPNDAELLLGPLAEYARAAGAFGPVARAASVPGSRAGRTRAVLPPGRR